ncbi:FecCD family ABC transporter permease [Natronorubrum daqingense]|uniref:Cobalamin import system permease protein BtuC n=1 Tax=Natronorubrum daqingense TaxID=588898 RepID=A0A1N7FRD2_9EURY|nr:iron ABC transporter permease [Natronorubrum daqingense]SIS02922.1 iron complex transport system permease protein [Natronorubrum daqingense]
MGEDGSTVVDDRSDSGASAGISGIAPSIRRGHFERIDSSLLALALASTGIVLASLFVQVSYGTYTMSITDAWFALLDADIWHDPRMLLSFVLGEELMRTVLFVSESYQVPELATNTNIVWNMRFPRVLVAIFVGMNLAISGAIFQAVTRNELASPYILGVSSGAGLAILLTLVVFSSANTLLPITAAAGGTGAFVIVYAIAWKGGTSPIRLVLAGVIVATVCTSLQTALYLFAEDISTVQSAVAWTTGSLTGADWGDVRLVFPWTVLAICLALAGSRQLNVLLLGEQTAGALGMSVERVRFALSAVAILAAAASIAVAGIVGFVGLIVPHVVRTIVGSDYKRLMIGCLFVGPALLVSADVGARLGMQVLFDSPNQLPVGILTGLIGGPYFLYLMRKREQLGEL